jgi:diguanylate cyclase (GGDEF)-like protein
MSFDISTLYLFATMVAAMLGAMLLFFGNQEKIPALKWWGSAYLLGAAAVAASTIAGARFGDIASLAMNAAGFIACGMVWNAARVFHGRKPNIPGLVLGAIAWVGVALALPSEQSMLKLTIGAAIIAIYACLTAAELGRERRRAMQRRWPALALPALHGSVLLLPILLGNVLRPHDAAFGDSVWVTVFSVELILYAIGTVFVIFMLVSDREVTAHKTAASMDPLTGMFNRRGFAEACARVIEREAGAGRPVTVMIFDIDHFKSINDRFGHPAGDEILKLFSAVVVNNLRITDLSGRIGGEEFAALLPCPLEEGVIVAERVRECFQTAGIVCDEGAVDTTVSIGVAGGPAGTELEVLLAAADTALYQAKRGGRNRVEAAEELPLSLENWRRKMAGLAPPTGERPIAA